MCVGRNMGCSEGGGRRAPCLRLLNSVAHVRIVPAAQNSCLGWIRIDPPSPPALGIRTFYWVDVKSLLILCKFLLFAEFAQFQSE